MSFLIAIVGRPNVGKSRLFNRLSQTGDAIVHDFEGVTRDRQYADGKWYDNRYTVIDTGGFVPEAEEPMLRQMRNQAQLAMDEADLIVFLLDGRDGILPADREIAQMLRQATKPVLFAVNKIDSPVNPERHIGEFYELGTELYPISAEHGHGVAQLMDEVCSHIPEDQEEEAHEMHARIAVVGKPNAGKSSTINALLGEDRLLTSEVAGTTRDAIDTRIARGDQEYLLIDTAGLRRKKKISHQLEEYAVVQAIRSIDRADVVLFVIDATEGITWQDKKIADVVKNRGKACVIIVNKWDLVAKETATAGEYVHAIHREMPFMAFAPIMFVSALTGQRVHKILDRVDEVFEQYTSRISTSEANRFLEQALGQHNPPMHKGRPVKFYYASQVATRPPTFLFSVNRPQGVKPSYRRYLVNKLREVYGFEGTPIKTVLRGRGEE
ncbi:ribosome biogenesis GTPase Der [Persicimonas caeni]|uniref:GTPase Der n=1 Tax=Persicimonas caeni TaxID=2292766 RepID=A0A4Y6Q1P2_PERCE|nr:ribosome biogenesis GTPase Der [Persicimonas caeni]QDG54473.1 ribosome biogenesis GTPase Der [Persicimonas caeni]QED35694.1 ribosome biogenesis GTPase Der [Persicimonas caeni]